MKRIILFFAVCLGLSVSQTTFADDAETARAASKRGQTNTVSVSPTQNQSNSRSVSTNTRKTETTQNKNSRTAVKPVQQQVVTRTPVQQRQNVKQRSATNQQATVTSRQPETKSRVVTTSRVGTNRSANTNSLKVNSSRTARSATSVKTNKKNVRAAALDTVKIESIKNKDFSKCKTVYFECMDEFCANKDTNLRRCACSSRVHEFDSIKKQLSKAEDKMLDFNQRLLTVNLEKEDALAINVATEGEIAYQTKDKTESEKLLQKITDSLNSSGDSKINNNLSSISLSLDMDSAWDDIDSLGGISTTSKSGLDLYNAAQPICVEMAMEVCSSEEELDIAKSSYQLTIQQDCNTVAKSYDNLYNQAQTKIHESAALLDMSRLNIYQQRNSDDILTCKKKILTQLSDASVCGENLYKCLDTTGEYINPSTGQAVLSENLYNLTALLQTPEDTQTWSSIDKNEKFVDFLNSKKAYLEPAIEQCQDIADTVWDDFLDDALAQIKLAQNSKLEEIRQSCTTLVSECKIKSLEDLSEFDARALSTFSVVSDKTVNEMCSQIENSCVALMNNIDATENWEKGMSGISADITHDTIIESCTQIGRDCIIRQCNGISGNFALCTNANDAQRIAILSRKTCWGEVYDCVKQADNLDKIDSTYKEATKQPDNDDYYFDKTCGDSDKACLITKQIWGDCEYNPTKYDITGSKIIDKLTDLSLKKTNKITPDSSTLLSWFAANTGTSDAPDNCNAKGCLYNYYELNGKCTKTASECLYSQGVYGIPANKGCITNEDEIITTDSGIKNYCEIGKKDTFKNCCAQSNKTVKNAKGTICVPNDTDDDTYSVSLLPLSCSQESCPKVYCVSTNTNYIPKPESESDDTKTYLCRDGFWLLVDENGNYNTKFTITTTTTTTSGTTETETELITQSLPENLMYYYDGTNNQPKEVSNQPTSGEYIITYEALNTN